MNPDPLQCIPSPDVGIVTPSEAARPKHFKTSLVVNWVIAGPKKSDTLIASLPFNCEILEKVIIKFALEVVRHLLHGASHR
jgi:hypothetical protein